MCNCFNLFQNSIKKKEILNIIEKINTPFWLYDIKMIYKKIKLLNNFDIIRFAQKACSNINILKLMKKKGVKIDAVSLGEIERAIQSGFSIKENDIVFTADIFDQETVDKITKFNIPVNIGSIDMLHQLGKISPNHDIWIRINPGFGHGHNKKTNTGGNNSKHGILYPKKILKIIKEYGFNVIGLHMHIGSGVNYEHLQKVCNSMLHQAYSLNIDISSISAGGGISVPYKDNENHVDINHYFSLWNKTRKKIENYFGHHVNLEIEPGRFLVAESGILICKIYTIKKTDKYTFILVDAGFNDLMRPILYGSYHKITILPQKNRNIDYSETKKVVIGGPLCEAGDIFTQNKNGNLEERDLPLVEIGDYLIFHNTGAYGASMSSIYNSRPLIPEILYENNSFKIIRKKQTIHDLLKLENSIIKI
ncbi:diaminopimelate decarboxylase [Buchnera aphidicola (Kurisakia onigurumii)]|uniref:diaminopimelate decarboxylase n=1 Tax=Buchnera aphidicola TaxID=9 RepID=UPI0031B72DC4